MFELLKLARVLGVGHLLRLRKARGVAADSLVRGFLATPAINALFEVGFFDALVTEKQVNIESFAAQRDLDLDILMSLCDYLYALGFINGDGNTYTLSPKGQLLAGELRGTFSISRAYSPVINSIAPMLTGKSRLGVDVYKNIQMSAQGSGETGMMFMFPLVKDIIRRKGFKKVLDIGCGDATFLIDLCKTNPDITAYGLDLSAEAIEDGRRNVAQHNLEDRTHLYVEDMFNLKSLALQLEGIEVATSFFILHEFLRCGSSRVMDFLEIYRQTFPNVSLILCDSIRHTRDQLRKRGGPLAEFQLTHDLTGQMTITREQWKSIFAEAGFTSVEEDYFDLVRMVIHTIK